MLDRWFLALPQLCLVAIIVSAQTSPVPAPPPLTIEGAVSEALQHNLSLLAQRYNVSIAEAAIITARLRPNPVLSLSADHLDLLGTSYNSVNNGGPPEYALRTDFLFERGHKRERRVELSQATRFAAEAELENAARGLVLDVENAFLDLLLANESLALAEQNHSSLDEIVEINSVRVKSGDLSELELLRSRVAALQSGNQVYQARLRVHVARNRLQLLVGHARSSATLAIHGEPRREPGPAALEELLKIARDSRPDLEVLRRNLARSQADLRLQLAQRSVDYTLGSEYRRQDAVSGRGNSLGFFAQANLPIFNRNQGEIERARREALQIEARLRELEAGIAVEVANAYEQFQTSGTLLQGIERNMLQQARDVRDITGYSYRRGDASLIEFLDAQRVFNDTMQSYSEARVEYARSLYLLDATTGRTPQK